MIERAQTFGLSFKPLQGHGYIAHSRDIEGVEIDLLVKDADEYRQMIPEAIEITFRDLGRAVRAIEVETGAAEWEDATWVLVPQ